MWYIANFNTMHKYSVVKIDQKLVSLKKLQKKYAGHYVIIKTILIGHLFFKKEVTFKFKCHLYQ